MKFWLSICFIALSVKAFSQEKTMAGIVFDKSNKFRVAKVVVKNITTGESVYDNLNGVFNITAQNGDRLIFSQQEHLSDTIQVQNHTPLAIYMKKVAILLKEVTILDTLQDPLKKMIQILAGNFSES